MATDQACQDSCKTTRDCNEESNPMAPQPSEIQGDSNLVEPPRDCNEESNPLALQPSEIQGDSNPAEPPPVTLLLKDCNEESNPMALQPSEIQGDSNPIEPPPDCNEESNPMMPQPSELQGDSNPVEPPPDCIVESIPMTPHPREIQRKPNPAQPAPEDPMDVSLEGMTTDEASQDSGNSIRVGSWQRKLRAAPQGPTSHDVAGKVHNAHAGTRTSPLLQLEGERPKPMCPQAGCVDFTFGNKEVHEESSSESMATNDSPQYGRTTTRGSYDRPKRRKRKKEKEEEGGYEDMGRPVEDYPRWRQQKFWNHLNSKVQPRAVVNVNENYRSLFDAALRGDWKTIKKILNKDHAALMAEIMIIEHESFTVLDIAIVATQDQLVENLVKQFPRVYKNLNLGRALRYAARKGRLKMVKALIEKADAKSDIIGITLYNAIIYAPSQKEAIWYLARRLTCTPPSRAMANLIEAGHFDICFFLARNYPGLTTSKERDGVGCLDFLAIIPFHFRSGAQLNFWEKCIYKFIPLCLVDTSFDDSKDTKLDRVLKALNWIKISLWNLATIPAPFIKRSGESKLKHYYSLEFANHALDEIKNGTSSPEILQYILTSGVVLDAASRGVFEIVNLCLKKFPELMWDTNFAKKLIIKVVEGRHIELFRLVNENNPIRYLADDNYMIYDLMEAVIKWSSRCVSPDVSGAAFLMQRELQWFQVSDPHLFTPFLCSY
ncbi:hypothetical protein ACJRO7_016096 [Eucalyptus globulus]|uniref:Uncharacterized protein n=1 Tax=Eucalyptus globulus TaxID=34317 RepID=A0ABD3LBH1_EUCGL